MTGYEIYSAWCRERGQVPPTKEWWDWACAKDSGVVPWYARNIFADNERILDEIRADQAEIDRERREGWAYD